MPVMKVGGRPPTKFKPELMDKVLQGLAEGKTLREICKDQGMPKPATIQRWVREDEELFHQWQHAKELKSHSLFDEALDSARLLTANKGLDTTGTQVRGLQVAIQTLMEAAGKLNPQDYGQRRAGQVVVPIQIVTNMNMGQDGKPAAEDGTSIYEITVPYQVTDAADHQ